jgi:DNA primase
MSLGYDNIVATFGQFNVEQGMLFLPFQRIIFWPDNDKAGFENTYRAIEAIARYNRLDIVPVVEKMKGDAADLTADQIVNHLDAAYNSALLPMYGKLVTLSEVQK